MVEILSRPSYGMGDIVKRRLVIGPETRVVREDLALYSRHPRRRIDITIHLGKFAVGVENKPWAAEGDDQLHDYKAHLEKKHQGRFCPVYLAGDGNVPKSISDAERRRLQRAGKFKNLIYSVHLSRWLQACAKASESEHVRQFLEDFHRYVEQNFPAAAPVHRGMRNVEDGRS